MKKSLIYSGIILFFLAAVGFIIIRQNRKTEEKSARLYDLQPRKNISHQHGEWVETRTKATMLMEALRKNPADIKSSIAMAALFLQEARITGNYVYYDKAALRYVDNVLAQDSSNFDALTLKAFIYTSQHHFDQGLIIAEKARQKNPYNSFVYGMLVDGNVEMGNYSLAVENSDKMVSMRPDLRSYSRISYLREIHGDLPGAIEAMKLAVEAGFPGDEATEWSRVQLAKLFEHTGDLKNAEMHYLIALEERPGYAYALSGLARIAADKKDYNSAIKYLQQADSLVTDYSFKEELVDVYYLSGEKNKAKQLAQQVIDELTKVAVTGDKDEEVGHYADGELANAYLKVENVDLALKHALLEYRRRPDNIQVNEMMAWVHYKKGNYKEALPFMQTALKTNCKNPELLCKAGLVFLKNNDSVKARTLLAEALVNDPLIPGLLKAEAKAAIATL